MDFKAVLDKLKRSSVGGRTCFLVIQPDAVYLSSPLKSSRPSKFEISESNWERACEQALSVAASSYDSLAVVLSHNYYQMYQIDKPAMPRNEWPAALPFLLKELISERAIDIIADAVELPNSNKVQAYVLSRKILDKLVLLASRAQLPLEAIIPEDDVWGDTSGELGNFLLLQRSARGHFRISAFVEHTIAFHRSIRSVTPPLTGVPSSELQMDSLSLELQRSIDYLSSQLRHVQLHQLKVCCDDEDENELVESLNYRLSTKVSALLAEDHEPSGHVLADTAATSNTRRVNLYPDFLKPKKNLLTLKNVAISWGVAAAVIFLSYGYVTWQSDGVEDEIAIVKSKGNIMKSELDRYQAQLRKHQPDTNKLAAKARLEREVKAKRDSLKAVGKYDDSQRTGYSGVMQSLAKLGSNNISLSEIRIDHNTLDLKGLARTPSSVPNWVSQFKNEISLIGRTFDDVKIGRNDDNIVTFELKTRGGKEEK
ncbi:MULTISPECIES: MSHA biogenesis protein MshI [Vibrio]|jgi:MSHA biogenesis protein MshI|uniref:MSHA biogenesis protein MshI n=1 Tax=Vibrio jasicida TaxID=766224 RepID=A0AAU9QMR3_9VIBR|nr:MULTISPECIES: MSHA biogenesis protein MshI [Vibrio]NOJ18862.1 MSHA biogenesis protein MshI [Vibrio jasicida]UQA50065.1 MSHA biogenesis protein MshI [Vibrio sp. ED002]CAH1581158.1 MSHA biogenesis protein MshI [Vibrio jasicida]CAH1590835.1 MSHA biogenesis protein MshI [Vibrio jasicida]